MICNILIKRSKKTITSIDIIAVLTESERLRKYWNDLKTKLKSEGSELSEKIGQLKMMADDVKMRNTDVANTEQILRLVQSILSPKAESFKMRLAQVVKLYEKTKILVINGGAPNEQ